MAKTTGARNGRGSVTQAKTRDGKPIRNVWRICYSWTDSEGERHKENATHHGTKAEAWQICDSLRAAREGGLKPEGRKITFAQFAQDWQQAREESGELARKSLEESARSVRKLSGYIGDKALAEIDAATIERLFRDMRRDGTRADGTTIKNRTILKYYQHLKQIMQKACNYDYIMRNPCAKVRPPKPEDVERRALSAKDARRLLATLERREREERAAFDRKEERQAAWKADKGRKSLRGLGTLANIVGARLTLATGLRLGELLGLTWGAVDLRAGCLEVRQSLTEHGETKPPKTAAGRRTVWLDPATVAHLAQWKRFQAAQLRKIGAAAEGRPLAAGVAVVCSDVGGFSSIRNYERWWISWRDSNGFRGLKFHELRHTQATQLLANGADVKTVQARLGHSDPALTLKWYAHTVEENDKRAAALMGGLLASPEQRQSA